MTTHDHDPSPDRGTSLSTDLGAGPGAGHQIYEHVTGPAKSDLFGAAGRACPLTPTPSAPSASPAPIATSVTTPLTPTAATITAAVAAMRGALACGGEIHAPNHSQWRASARPRRR
jgi:hypothetical protein